MTVATKSAPDVAIRIYYAATALFLVLDYAFDLNVRLSFLEAWPGWRALYYLVCFGCLGVIVWRPALTTIVATLESLTTLCMLLISMGFRVMTMSTTFLETGDVVTAEEIVNFFIVGSAAWIGWFRGTQQLQRDFPEK